ncbi:MAG TPA: phosphoribosylglycinamide formyltransferase [Tepidisphaeraceae bacterium]|jgi:formyltetrahydrofolate-dependent phosphoribosylglycinamide formyltransferase|nr:phosphoribosylglycinamide formyltransferase [Tepidisphaeraceae bacterium]
MGKSPINLAVLVSGSGRTLQNFVDEIAAGRLDAQISLVIGSKAGLGGLQRAADAKLPNFVVDRKSFASAEEFSKQIFSLCDDAGVDLVCLAGWLCLLPVPERYLQKVMNIHPALLPSFGGKGMYGHHVHEAVLEHGCKMSGCTVHFVDNTYDTGPIVMQRVCPVLDDDTADTLAGRVFIEELGAYPAAIRLFAEERLKVQGRRVLTVNL